MLLALHNSPKLFQFLGTEKYPLEDEYEKFLTFKKEKEQKQWKSMAGFFNNSKMVEMVRKEKAETTLREKIKR